MCVPAIAGGLGKAAGFMVSPAASIIGALGKKKPSTPTQTQAAASSTSGGGY